MSEMNAPAQRPAFPVVDEATIGPFLAAAGEAPVLLVFAADPARSPETRDLAVILPELVAAFAAAADPLAIRAAVVPLAGNRALMARFGVRTLPSLVALRSGVPCGVIARLLDWPGYLHRIRALFTADAAALDAGEAA